MAILAWDAMHLWNIRELKKRQRSHVSADRFGVIFILVPISLDHDESNSWYIYASTFPIIMSELFHSSYICFLILVCVCVVYANDSICLDIVQNQWSPIYDRCCCNSYINTASRCQVFEILLFCIEQIKFPFLSALMLWKFLLIKLLLKMILVI